MQVYKFKNVKSGIVYPIKEDQPETVKRLKKDKESYELIDTYEHEHQGTFEGDENQTDEAGEGEPLILDGMPPDEIKEAFTADELRGEASRRGLSGYKKANKDDLVEMLLADE